MPNDMWRNAAQPTLKCAQAWKGKTMIITIERDGIEHKTSLSDEADISELLTVIKMIMTYGLGYNFGDDELDKIQENYDKIRDAEKKGSL